MSLHAVAVPTFVQILTSLAKVLDKAEASAAARKIQPEVLLASRLYPDMLPLTKQIQLACDFAAKGCARLTASEVPSTADTETSFAELKTRIAKTIDYVKAFQPAQFNGSEARNITFPSGPGATTTLTGQQFLNHFSLPNFYFHSVTAYDILRHNGVEVGKRDFLGTF